LLPIGLSEAPPKKKIIYDFQPSLNEKRLAQQSEIPRLRLGRDRSTHRAGYCMIALIKLYVMFDIKVILSGITHPQVNSTNEHLH